MKMILKILTLFGVCFWITSCSIAQKLELPELEDVHSLNDIFKPYVEQGNTWALSVGVYQNGELEFHHYGKISKNNPEKPTNESIYEIGSISKTFTAALLAGLVEEGTIGLDDNICIGLPKEVCTWSDAGPQITFRQLSTHTSGLPRLPTNLTKSFMVNRENPYAAYTMDELYAYLKDVQPIALAERKSEYSNLGVGLLGNLLANLKKTTYAEMSRERIFKPLDMSSTAIDVSSEEQNKYVDGHNEKGKITAHWDMPALAGAGAIKSTITDMMKYLQANIKDKTHLIRRINLNWISGMDRSKDWDGSFKGKAIWKSFGTMAEPADLEVC